MSIKAQTNIKKLFYSLFAIYLILSTTSIIAQEPFYYTLSEENGSPSSEVYQIKQDKFGFIWIGCEAGLYRYDGVRFKHFSYKNANSRAVSNIKIDSKNRIWCQNFTGQIYYVEEDTLKLFKDFSSYTRVFPHYCIDKNNGIWVATEKYIEKFDYKGVSENKFFHVIGKDTTIWYDIEITPDNNILASSLNFGLCKIELKLGKIEVLPIKRGKSTGGRITLESIKDSVFIIEEIISGLKYDLSIYHKNKLEFLKTTENQGFLYKVAKDIKGDVWLCSSKGLVQFQSINDPYNKCVLQNDKISSFFEDKEGNIWLTSLQNGIHVIPKMSFYNNQLFKANLKDNYISTIHINEKNEVLAGTYSGSVYKLKDSSVSEIFKKSKGNYGLVKKIMKYKNNYFISRIKFSYFENEKEYSFEKFRNLRDFAVLNDTIYYVTSFVTGCFPLSAIKMGETNFLKSIYIIQSRGAKSIIVDSISHTVFFASNEGLFKFNGRKLEEIRFNKRKIFAVKLVLHNKDLWIATVSDGLYKYTTDKIEKPRLINETIKGNQIRTFKTQGNQFWIATEIGLNKINLDGKTTCFGLSDGLTSKEINDIDFNDTRVFLATNKGIISFDAQTQSENTIKPTIKIKQIKLNNENISSNEINKICYNDRLSFNFIGPCFKARGNFKYKYRLLGLDSNWVTVDALNNEAIYQSLPAGNFTFEVKTINEDGYESEQAAFIKFTVDKPFKQTIWFYLIIAFAVTVVVSVVSVLVIKDIRKKNSIKNKLVQSQLTAIRAQMNPHFMYNTLNSIQDLILKKDFINTNYYLSKFSTLMRNILEFSAIEEITVEEELEMLNLYLELEKLRFGDEFKYQVNAEITLIHKKIPSLIIQPFVENAVKHGLLHKKGEKTLSIKFSSTDHAIHAEILDNGIGRLQSSKINSRSPFKPNSFAIGASSKRIELLNDKKKNKISFEISDLYDNSVATGTYVKVTFPYN